MPFSAREAQFVVRRYLCAQCYSTLGYEILDINSDVWECVVVCSGEIYESCGDVEDVGRVTKYFAIQEGQKRADQYDRISERERAFDGDKEVLARLQKKYDNWTAYLKMTSDERMKTLGFD